MIGRVVSFDEVNKADLRSKIMVPPCVEECFQGESPSRQPSSGVPPNWNRVLCLSSSLKARAVMIKENTLLHMSISIIPRHLFGPLRSPFL